MSRKWDIVFEGEEPGTADDFTLTFIDLRDIMGDFLELKEKAMRILVDLIKSHDNYHAVGNIKEVIPPELEEIELQSIWALLGIDKDDLRFGFLFRSSEEGSLLIGVWPKAYADAIKDNNRLLGGVIIAMLEKPNNWKCVDAVLPLKETL
ncbi:MAG: hypothetical protein J7L07_04535 [Candidatus Odinarchaeota archaeon]|nr:hypothetical protein [Candidatus Odinarchaeota archaeon]